MTVPAPVPYPPPYLWAPPRRRWRWTWTWTAYTVLAAFTAAASIILVASTPRR
jgi:hypothetical protein